MEEYCKAELGYREIEYLETKLRVYYNGDIWRLSKGGNNRKGIKKGEWYLLQVVKSDLGYYIIKINNKHIRCHRIIGMVYLGLDINNPKDLIDHKNRIRTDNRVENLQIVDNQKNCFNTNAKGCYFQTRTKKWQSSIIVNGTSIYLGCYHTEEEAHQSYLNAKLIYHII